MPVAGDWFPHLYLLDRSRAVAYPTLATKLLNYLFWEPVHFLMERKMLLTIEALAEQEAKSRRLEFRAESKENSK